MPSFQGVPGRQSAFPPRRLQVQKSFQERSEWHCSSIKISMCHKNRFWAPLKLHLSSHWNPKIVILQGRGIKNQQFHFFLSSSRLNSNFHSFWPPWGSVWEPKAGPISMCHGGPGHRARFLKTSLIFN